METKRPLGNEGQVKEISLGLGFLGNGNTVYCN